MNDRSSLARIAFAIAGALLLSGSSRAQCSEWSDEFGVPGVEGDVRALAVFDDGSGPALYVGGWFIRSGDVVLNGIGRWDGSEFTPLGGGLTPFGTVEALLVFDDGTGDALYATGRFEQAGGQAANGIAKWDGSSWSALGTGLSAVFGGLALASFDDGNGPALYVGGDFNNAGGMPSPNIAKWDGVAWSSLGPGLSDDVYSLQSFDDGTGSALYVGGAFHNAGGDANADFLAMWDGSSWSNAGVVDHFVHALTVFDAGNGSRLYAGGIFSTIGGTAVARAASWDGSTWSAVGSALRGGPVEAFHVHDDGTGPALYAAGGFNTNTTGTPVGGVAKWGGPGQDWSGVGTGFVHVEALESFQPAGSPTPLLFAGGPFTAATGRVTNHIAQWDGATWSFGAEPGNGIGRIDNFSAVHSLRAFDDGGGEKLFVGGRIDRAADQVLNHVGTWDGSEWDRAGTELWSTVRALAVHDMGTGNGPELYAGGDFGGQLFEGVGRWNGTAWLPVGSEIQGQVMSFASYDSGSGPELYAGGTFNESNPDLDRIARWDGVSWQPVGGGIDAPFSAAVRAMAVFDDGSGPVLYVGGNFTAVSGMNMNYIARWDGTAWSDVGGGMSGGSAPWVRSMCVFDDGTGPALYVGGRFALAGGLPIAGIARWDGQTWSDVGGSLSAVAPSVADGEALAIFDDGRGQALYVGGTFSGAGSQSVSNLARWNGLDWEGLGSGVNGTVHALAPYDDGTGTALFLGGRFSAAGGNSSQFIAKWSGPGEPVAYCAGKMNSEGCVPFITTSGTPSASSSLNFQIRAEDVIDGNFGFLMYGSKKANLNFHGGKLCIKSPIERLLPPKFAKAEGTPPCRGVLRRNFNKHIQAGLDPSLTPGRVVFAQWFQRDPMDPAGFGDSLTNAVRFEICP